MHLACRNTDHLHVQAMYTAISAARALLRADGRPLLVEGPHACRCLHAQMAPGASIHDIPPELLTKAPTSPKAVFVKSSVALNAMPHATLPEVAVIGHSNVGKSSLINLITGDSSLAKVSKQPGKTRCINHFMVSNKFYLVDCPGYGYAQVSKQQRVDWHHLTQSYFTERLSLALVLLLVDSGQPVNRLDIDAALWLHEQRVPYTLVWTKVDAEPPAGQVTASGAQVVARPACPPPGTHPSTHQAPNPSTVITECRHSVDTFLHAIHHITGAQDRAGKKRKALQDLPPYFIMTSSKTKLGRDVLLSHIWAVQDSFQVPITFR